MRRTLSLLVAVGIAVSLLALAGPAGAQTGDLAAFCADRIAANNAEGKAANLAIMNEMVAVAPAAALAPMTALRDAYQKKGEKLFDGPDGFALLTPVDAWIYHSCPGTQIPVTAIDYEYEGMPAALAAGVSKFKLTNAAPKEDHMLAIAKLTPEAAGKDVKEILALPEKKVGDLVDFSNSAFMYAPPGQSGYSPIDLEPGTYMYACFLPVGGKKNGAPHFAKGMYGTFTVQ